MAYQTDWKDWPVGPYIEVQIYSCVHSCAWKVDSRECRPGAALGYPQSRCQCSPARVFLKSCCLWQTWEHWCCNGIRQKCMLECVTHTVFTLTDRPHAWTWSLLVSLWKNAAKSRLPLVAIELFGVECFLPMQNKEIEDTMKRKWDFSNFVKFPHSCIRATSRMNLIKMCLCLQIKILIRNTSCSSSHLSDQILCIILIRRMEIIWTKNANELGWAYLFSTGWQEDSNIWAFLIRHGSRGIFKKKRHSDQIFDLYWIIYFDLNGISQNFIFGSKFWSYQIKILIRKFSWSINHKLLSEPLRKAGNWFLKMITTFQGTYFDAWDTFLFWELESLADFNLKFDPKL